MGYSYDCTAGARGEDRHDILKVTLDKLCEQEGIEGVSTKDRLEMLAWDVGYQGHPLATWVVELGGWRRWTSGASMPPESGRRPRTADEALPGGSGASPVVLGWGGRKLIRR